MSYNTYFGFLAAVILSAIIVAVAATVPGVSADDDDLPPPPPKQTLTYPNLGSHLSGLADTYEEGSASQSESAGQAAISQGGSVAVTIHLSANVADVVQFLEDNGGDPRNVGEDYVEAYVPVSLLGQLSEQPGVIRVREIIPPQPRYGNVTSQGVAAHLATAWHDAGFSGQGVKVGIIDSGFRGWQKLEDVELPGRVEARCYTDVGIYSANLAVCDNPDKSEHGTAVAEAVIDIAPNATLYIADPDSKGDLREIVDWMASQGVQVINVSLGWAPDGPGDGTSPDIRSPLNAVDRAVASGITWVNAGGNEGRSVWYGPLIDTDADGFHEWAPPEIEGQAVLLEEGDSITVFLRWEDSWPGASRDLYVDIYDPVTEQVLRFSNDPQSGESGHNPVEELTFEAPYDGEFWISVEHISGAVPDWIQLILWGPGLPYYTDYNMYSVEESANRGMLAVGAAHYWDTNTISPSSSRGPTIDGRTKPDIVGVDCAAAASYELRPPRFYGGNNCWFPGTSQAAPHVAGLAALVKQANPSFTPQQVAEYLKSNAVDREPAGPDDTWGYGFAQLPVPPDEISDECGESITADGATAGEWSAGCESEVADRGYARYYGITLGESSEVTISLESTVDTYLYLRDGEARSGTVRLFNDDHEDGGLARTTDSQIVATLPAGSYTVEATTFRAGDTGSFTLTVSGLGGTTTTPDPDPTDECGESITADGATAGEWSAGCESEVADRGYARYYGITLGESSEVTISLESTVDTYLYLRDGEARSGTVRLFNDDHEDGGLARTTDSQIVATLPAGSYTVEATTFRAGDTGSFTLTVSGLGGTTTTPDPDPTDECGESITADGATAGEWSAGCESEVADRGYARYYGITLGESSEVTISLESTVDTYLYLRDGEARSGTVRLFNDDHEDGGLARTTDSQIVATLPAGSYTVEATTFRAGDTGSFTLTVSGLGGTTTTPDPDPTDECGESITADGATAGEWSAGCESEVADRGYARYYGITLGESSEVTISLESTVDTYLYLRDGEARSGTVRLFNDDHEDGGLARTTDSQIVATLPAGSYTVEATTFRAGDTGSFTLTVSRLGGTTTTPDPDPTDECGESITADGATAGEWSAGCESEVADRGYARYYGITLGESSEVTISLESTVDTYLYLRDGEARSGTVRLFNDDHEDGGLARTTDSQIVATLPAGSYTVEATTFRAGDTGSFTLTVSGLGGTSSPGMVSEREALTALYNATDGANWANSSGWLTNAPLGEWHGVYSNSEGSVTVLTLLENGLNGTIPRELSSLRNLQRLHLDDNRLTGTIPAELGSLTELTRFTANNILVDGESVGGLTGELPLELTDLTNLTMLALAGHDLNGELPAELGNLTNLEELYLWRNEFTGSIPSSLETLTNLTDLYLQDNQFTGCIPAGLEDIEDNDLHLLGLPYCGSGSESPEGSVSGDRAALEALYNATDGPNWENNDNWLTDAPLDQWHGVTTGGDGRVIEVDLLRGGLTGSIPAAMGNLNRLERLGLGRNSFRGSLPSELGNLTKLTFLDLTHLEIQGGLTGDIPPELGNLTELTTLYLGGHDLSGELPTELRNLTKLGALVIWDNQLTGAIPSWMGDLTQLSRLELWSNQFSGTIPSELGNLTQLTSLHLGGNQLTGTIPTEIGNLIFMRNLRLEDNQLTGSIPTQLGNLSRLEYLYLGGNQLTGTIPTEIGNLRSLLHLWLNNNQLTGSIPTQLENLTLLEALFLGGNQLTGCIPALLFDVPNNDLRRLMQENNLAACSP